MRAFLASFRRHGDGPLLTVGVFRDYEFCPLYFWHKDVLSLPLLPEESEGMGGYDLGIVFHGVLEEFLLPLVGKTIGKGDAYLLSEERLLEIFGEVAERHRMT